MTFLSCIDNVRGCRLVNSRRLWSEPRPLWHFIDRVAQRGLPKP